jgi:hypothetical protein
MSSFPSRLIVALLGVVALLATATPAPAQPVYGGFRGPGFGMGPSGGFRGPGFGMNPYGGFRGPYSMGPYGGFRGPYSMGPMYGGMYGGGMYGGGMYSGFQPFPPGYFGPLGPVQNVQPVPAINTFNPLMYNPLSPNYSQMNFNAVTYNYLNRAVYGGGGGYSGPTYGSGSYPAYTSGGSYGGSYGGGYSYGGGQYGATNPYSRDYGRAQQENSAQASITSQWGYEKKAVPVAAPGAAPAAPAAVPQDLAEALSVADESKLLSGEYLNRIKTEIEALEARGARAQSALIGPQLLAKVQFTGSPAADALNVIRRAGRLEFPAPFDTVPELRAVKPVLEQDLVAVASPAQLGKPVDPLKLIKMDEDVKRAQTALTAVVGTLPFEDATASRRLLNQLAAAVKALRDPKSAGLVNPAWETGGVSVSDLLKHMTKYKLQFGPADMGEGEAYVAVHQGLAGYLFALQQNEPKKK